MPLPHREQVLKQVVIRALASPVSLFLATTGALLIASEAAWPLGLAVLTAEAGWVWTRIRDPQHARQSSEEMLRERWRGLIVRLEAVSAGLDRDTAAALSAIVDSQERLLGMSGAEAVLLPATRLELTSLLEHCLSLADKRHQLQTHLATARSQDVQRQAMQLQSRLESCQDPVTRQLYEQALDQKRQELENYVRLEEAIHRIDGQLAVVQCTFDNMLSKVVRLNSADPLSEPATDPVFDELNQLTRRVVALEDSLNETLTLRGAG